MPEVRKLRQENHKFKVILHGETLLQKQTLMKLSKSWSWSCWRSSLSFRTSKAHLHNDVPLRTLSSFSQVDQDLERWPKVQAWGFRLWPFKNRGGAQSTSGGPESRSQERAAEVRSVHDRGRAAEVRSVQPGGGACSTGSVRRGGARRPGERAAGCPGLSASVRSLLTGGRREHCGSELAWTPAALGGDLAR